MSIEATDEVLAGLQHWRETPAAHQPTWPDPAALEAVTRELREWPPLVFAGEADSLRDKLAAASRGEAFVLQGGDCAETFAESTADRIRNKIRTILQMAAVLTYGGSVPIVKLGRMAGQYAKPRSSDLETRDGVTLPVYRGDAVNGHAFTEASRTPDPERLLRAYHHSATTINLIRAFTQGGYADLRLVHDWNRGFLSNPAYARYEVLAGEIDRAMRFMDAAGVDFDALQDRRPLLLPRGAAARLRGGAHPHRLAHRPAVQHLRPLPVDRRAHPAARRRARRPALAGAQPHRRQARAHHHRRRRAGAHGPAQPRG